MCLACGGQVDTVLLDKTGTLTMNKPTLTDVVPQVWCYMALQPTACRRCPAALFCPVCLPRVTP